MPCDDCNKKKGGVVVHDTWKDGALNTMESGGVRAGKTNTVLKKNANDIRYSPYSFECKSCEKKLPSNSKYCQTCAQKKGRCSMCGKKVFDTRGAGSVGGGFRK
eukprot:Sspe_Gene.10474::Locus_3501_Transcript_2_3_Confidence_0.400_Length_2085::g.10474::m.10474